ncbi:type I restriction enzyme HsdR N-terminal domain-containing protein [Pollutibacter soli]|uniref:type I restriction enzyme HsdR N-terminal domain-containing protein n=1 Tax=Pollutibacter soli TaxID=3034157 RepID=UPI003013C183
MILIEYPEPAFKTRVSAGKKEIFDACRKSWVRLTPEEWVRQNILNWLITKKGYPAAIISVEKEIWLGKIKKRFDVLIYNGDHQPWMMIECKSQNVMLSEDVLMQVLRYNMVVPVQYLVITNGNNCFVAERADGTASWLDNFPDYPKSVKN